MYKEQSKLLSFLYLITIGWGIITIWIARHPPLIDLPQHAGQVALFRDLLLGNSNWQHTFAINWLTPYLVSNVFAALLSIVMPIVTAFKILLSIGYVLFVLMCVKLRKHFDVDARLDWLFILPFFGFAYQWGFLSFVLSAPVGLLFILIADYHAKKQTLQNSIFLILVGLFLLETHGLMFLFALGTGGTLLLVRSTSIKMFIYSIFPYILLATVFVTIIVINININASLKLTQYTLESNDPVWSWQIWEIKDRLYHAPLGTVVNTHSNVVAIIHKPIMFILIVAPFLMGLRVNLKNIPAAVFFFLVALVFAFIPGVIFGTAYVYGRFALFVIPSYALLFTKLSVSFNHFSALNSKSIHNIGLSLLVLACWGTFTYNSIYAWQFKNEALEIEEIIDTLEPNQKALTLMSYYSSSLDNNQDFNHFPAWYQAEKHGLVDFNFAYFAPMIVRYKPHQMPANAKGVTPEDFDWVKHKGDDYRYFITRSPLPKNIFHNAPCPPRALMNRGRWTIYENKGCAKQ